MTTMPKHTKHKKQSSNTDYSITKSYLFSIEQTLGLDSLFNDNIAHVNFDCPTNLREAFKTECRTNGTSTCKELTKYMANYVCTSRIKKTALSPTINRLMDANFTIESMNFTQNVQNRPRRLVNRNPDAVVNDDELDNRCMIGSCNNEAVEVMVYHPKGAEAKEFQVCVVHASSYSGSNVWSVKK